MDTYNKKIEKIALHDIDYGKEGIISSVDFTGSLQKRLSSMGLNEGSKIRVLESSCFASLRVYECFGKRISLHEIIARRILVV